MPYKKKASQKAKYKINTGAIMLLLYITLCFAFNKRGTDDTIIELTPSNNCIG